MDAAAPFSRAPDGRLVVDAVDVGEIVEQLEGRSAVVISELAVRAVARAQGERVIDAGDVDADDVLALLAAEGWWCRARSSHDVERIGRAGFPTERRVAGGGVRDDGFLKDALDSGVGAIEHHDETERANAERIAAVFGGSWPDAAPPPDAALDSFAGCAGLLAAVLRATDPLAIDAPWPLVAAPTSATAAWTLALSDAEPQATSLAGLGAVRTLTDFELHGDAARGDWLAIPVADALRPPRVNASQVLPQRVLVRGALWRFLPPARWPGVESNEA